jgi:Tat protein translocase TatB subunit
MFNVGGGELLVIMLVALIVLGPQRLPDAARQMGKAMGDLRRLSRGFQDEVRGALDTIEGPRPTAAPRHVLADAAPVPAPDAAVADAVTAVSRRPPAATEAPAKKATAKKATGKKATAKKATAKKAAGKKASANKATPAPKRTRSR